MRRNHRRRAMALSRMGCLFILSSAAACAPDKAGSPAGTLTTTDAPELGLGSGVSSPDEWRKKMARTPLPSKGCFEASLPNTSWEEVPCVASPHVPMSPATGPVRAVVSPDNSALVTPILSWAEGSFPTVSGVTSETDGSPNQFSLQLNTNFFPSPACKGAQVPSKCQGWEQFIYDEVDGLGSYVYIEAWLLNYVNPCPANWSSDGLNDCYFDSSHTNVPAQPVTNLANLTLTGSVSPTTDTVVLWTGGNNLSAHAMDSVVGLSGFWDRAEFNVFGWGDRTQAVFNAGSTIGVKVTLSDGSTASPACTPTSGSAETNNLNLVPGSCCATGGGPNPSITYLETNASGVTAPFCLLNDIVPITSPLMQ
jgi:hypothetical protein